MGGFAVIFSAMNGDQLVYRTVDAKGRTMWAVKTKGATRDTAHLKTQKLAVRYASTIAKRNKVDLFVLGRDKEIRHDISLYYR